MTKIAKTILQKKKAIGFILPDLKKYYKGMILKTEWYLREDRQTDQWNIT